MASLNLPGVGNVCYDVEVTNGANEFLWAFGNPTQTVPTDTRAVCSQDLGLSNGALTYFGPCDPTAPATNVKLFVDSLWATGVNVLTGTPLTDWVNPCPSPQGCVVTTTCTAGADVTAQFDLTVMREANQGFFDISVSFEDIFCTALVDCKRQGASGLENINMLLDPETGERVPTALLSFACTAGPNSNTHLLLSASLQCGDNTTIPLALGGNEGQLFTAANSPAPIIQAATFRGVDNRTNVLGQSSDVLFFNTAIALDFTEIAPPISKPCRLRANLSATAGRPDPPFATPSSTTYPVIRVNAPLVVSSTNGYDCAHIDIGDDPADGIWVDYTTPSEPFGFDFLAYESGSTVVVETRSVLSIQHYPVTSATHADSSNFSIILSTGQTSPFVLHAESANYELQGGLTSRLTKDGP